ncbi:unnamed protein product [Echinostoma caproni]|uniref:Uncharacterized protein n=1 Tax=Echinostoma caproni TaxID=27848 RepID=A0A183AS11_9TREM|nr:unnamed protein product [Echinostoma caproni]
MESTPVSESQRWNQVRRNEVSLYVTQQQSVRSPSRFTHASSKRVETSEQTNRCAALKEESVIEPCRSCSSGLGYAGSSGNMFFSVPDYGGTSNTVSAMVSIHQLLDVPNDSHNGSTSGVDLNASSCNSLLPAKFVEALEAELIHYFQPKESSSDSNTTDLVAELGDCRVPERVLSSSIRTVQPNNLSHVAVQKQFNARSSVVATTSASNSSMEQYLEFPPKRVLRKAIRQLIHRVTQAVAAARAVGAHVASRSSSSSDDESMRTQNSRYRFVKDHLHKLGHARTCADTIPDAASSSDKVS